jgi:hypothetical protein
MGPKGGDPVLGVLIDETLAPPASRGVLVDVNVDPGELAMVKRLRRLVDTMMGAHDNRAIDQHEDKIVRLPAKGYGTTEFDMSEERRTALVDSARRAMRDHLARARAAPRGAATRGAGDDVARTDRIALEILAL